MTDTAFDRIRSALRDNVEKVRDIGNRTCEAQCPVHDDRNPSLSVRGIEGTVLMRCHAGCDNAEVMTALGLTMRDLYDNPHGADYHYPDGRVVHRRWNPQKLDFKDFPQSGNTKGTALYRSVTEAAKAGHTVYVVEGEKDVHALEALGAVATCSAMGASNADKADWTPLTGANVVIVADKDKAGEKYAQQVRDILAELDCDIEIVQAKTGKDAADHIAAGHGVDEFDPAEHMSPVDKRYHELRSRLLDAAGLRNIPPPTPLVDDYLYRDSLAWISGKPGHGKSFVAVDLACCVGTGTTWHGNRVAQGRVLYLIAEGASGLSLRVDAWSLATGQPVQNVLFLPLAVQFLSAGDVAAFTRLIDELAPDLVILDTQARVTVGGEENSAKDMGQFVNELEKIRAACHACILIVHHEARAGENMRGSTALEGAATTILRVAKDGQLIEIMNPKQKDAPEQHPLTLTLTLTPVGDSAILSHDPMGIRGLATESELALLAILRDSFGTRGATKTELKEASDQAKSTYYRSINALVSKGLVIERKEGRSSIYTPAADNLQTEIPTSPTESHEPMGRVPQSHTPIRGGTPWNRDNDYPSNTTPAPQERGRESDSQDSVQSTASVEYAPSQDDEPTCCDGGLAKPQCQLCRHSNDYWEKAS